MVRERERERERERGREGEREGERGRERETFNFKIKALFKKRFSLFSGKIQFTSEFEHKIGTDFSSFRSRGRRTKNRTEYSAQLFSMKGTGSQSV